LDNPEDFVRLELATALKRGIRVIPALVHGATIPRAEELPEELAPLIRRNAIEISDQRFHYDSQRLIDVLERALGAAAPAPAGSAAPALRGQIEPEKRRPAAESAQAPATRMPATPREGGMAAGRGFWLIAAGAVVVVAVVALVTVKLLGGGSSKAGGATRTVTPLPTAVSTLAGGSTVYQMSPKDPLTGWKPTNPSAWQASKGAIIYTGSGSDEIAAPALG
jgi:hypothetical protein